MRRRARPRSIGWWTRWTVHGVAGVRSNVAFLGALCRAPHFREGHVDTGFIDRHLTALGAVPHAPDHAAAALGVAQLLRDGTASVEQSDQKASPWNVRDGFQLGGARLVVVPIVIEGQGADAAVTYGKDGMNVGIAGAVPAADAKVFEAHGEAFVSARRPPDPRAA